MAYISKPLVRKFRILNIRRLDVFKFETILRNQLTPIFRKQYIFILQTSSDIIDLTCVFYQTNFQHILNGKFVLNKGN